MSENRMTDTCVLLVNSFGDFASAKQKICQVQHVIATYDITIPPIATSQSTPPVLDVSVINEVECGVQHCRAAGICAKVFTAKYHWKGNRLSFLTIPDHSIAIASTYEKIVEAFQTYWQIHRLQKRYFGRLEYHRKSFLDGMADEIESIIDSNSLSKSLLISSTQIVGGIQVTGPRLASIKEALKPLRDYVNAEYAEISKGFNTVARQHYIIDYGSGRLAGKKAYKEIFT